MKTTFRAIWLICALALAGAAQAQQSVWVQIEAQPSLTVAEGLFLTTSRDILQAMADGHGPRNALVALGCAGWGPGQLETELAENSWLTVPSDGAILFQVPLSARWHGAAGLLGVDMAHLADYSGRA